MAQLTTGALIAGYRVDGLAGRGGMGVVYRATQLSLGRTIALKLIAPALAGDQHFRERFERESRLAAAIDHPKTWLVKAGARFAVPRQERAVFGFRGRGRADGLQGDAEEGALTPRDGSLIQAYLSRLVWRVSDGTRQLAQPLPGADTNKVPSTGLAQIPLVPGGRTTQVTLKAPRFLLEHRRFVLHGRVRSTSGIPTGRCVFYRIDPTPRKERGDTPVPDGRCAVRLKFSGSDQVRYSVHFIGDPGWHGSIDATPPIEVLFG